MITLLEVVLGPLWGVGVPVRGTSPTATLVGGAIVLEILLLQAKGEASPAVAHEGCYLGVTDRTVAAVRFSFSSSFQGSRCKKLESPERRNEKLQLTAATVRSVTPR